MAELKRKTGCQGWRKRFHCLVSMPLVALVLASGTASLAWAECDPATNDKGDQLKCKFDTLAVEGAALMEQLQKPPFAELQTPASLDGLAKSKARLDKEKGRLQADDFRLLTKKKDASCQLVEILNDGIGDDNGVCDTKNKPEESCAEVIGDGIGDDDGICSPMKGKKREACVQICDEATMQDEENVDADLAAEYEGVLDEVTGHAREMNDALQEVALAMSSLSSSEDPLDPCPLDTGGLSRINFLVYLLSKTAAVSARGATDIGERFCDSEAVAGCAACCAPAEAVAGGLEAAWTAIELTESSINSATIDAALSCVAKLKKAADANTALLKEVENDLKEVEASQEMIIQLLKLPQGQRPGFPISSTK